MSVEPTAPTSADQTTSDPAPLVPTDTPVTIREIAEFLRHLTDLRVSGRDADPDARAAFGHRKTELFTRLAADPSTPASPPAAERHTP
jgi:hypothetical protein